MSDNQAILIANSVTYGDTSKNIPVGVVRSIVSEFSANLENLGDFSFKTTSVINETTDEARRVIREKTKKASASDLLLIYYFGHGVKSPEDELFLYFKDSDFLELPSMLDFEEIVRWLRGYRVPKVIIALDCCYAGIVRNRLQTLENYSGDYYLMASVTHRGKAEVDYGDTRPIGTFSKYLLNGFTNPGAREPFKRDVTAESLFNFAEKFTKTKSKQIPYKIDGGLANEVLFKQESTISIPSAVKNSVPKKSTYRKLFILCSYISQGKFKSEEACYQFISKKSPREFWTPFQREQGVVEYDFMGFESFNNYIDLGRILGIIEEGAPITLTATGKLMIRNDGNKFNKTLLGAIEKVWAKHLISISDLEDAIGNRMRSNGVPSVDGIYFDMYLGKKISISKNFFKTLLDLTGHIGALKFTREPTYFLPTSFEDIEIE